MNGCHCCGDNRFYLIDKVKQDLLENTNIKDSPEEMKVLDNFLFRCWHMGWLDEYEKSIDPEIQKVIEENFFDML